MPFWTVEDAGPYKERLNFLMRRSLCRVLFAFRQAFFITWSRLHRELQTNLLEVLDKVEKHIDIFPKT